MLDPHLEMAETNFPAFREVADALWSDNCLFRFMSDWTESEWFKTWLELASTKQP
jgi:hypothetical protein